MPKTTLKQRLLPTAIIAVGLLILAALYVSKPTPEAAPQQARTWAITAIKAEPGTFSPNLQLYGSVESPRHSTLKSAISADVLEKPVDEGDSVRKGQLLILLDNRDAKLIKIQREADVKTLDAQIQAEYTRYKSDQNAIKQDLELVRLSEKEVNRRQRLFQSKTGSSQDLDNARKALANQQLQLTNREHAINDHKNRLANLQAQREKAQALANQAQLDVERAEIKAPFSGKVAELFVAVGNRVRPGDSLVELFDPDVLEVRAQIPQQYIRLVRKALNTDKAITAKAPLDNKIVTMTLDRLASKVESGRSGVDGLFSITKNSERLELGKTLALFLQLRPVDNTVALPTQALYGLDRVYKVDNDHLKAITVTRHGNIINPDGSQSILVSSQDIAPGDLIMTTQLPNAIDGLPVRIKGSL